MRGCRIRFSRWGKAGPAGLVFVHGGYAHAHWWDFIAPFFQDEQGVVALDLSGMGDSGHRQAYTAGTFAQEVMSVCAAAGLADRPVVVGHSFGGWVALKTGVIHGADLAGVVLVDYPIRPPGHEPESGRPRSRPRQLHLSLEAALRRFKLLPAQPCANQFILDYIARRSVRKVAGGWSWKFDERLFDGFEPGNPAEDVAALTCRVAVIHGEQSALFPRETIHYMSKLLQADAPLLSIPDAHHHVFLDQPLAFVAALRALLAQWRHASPAKVCPA